MTRHRRDERIIKFDADSIASLPPSISYNDIWYDKDQPYLAFRAKGTETRTGRQVNPCYLILAGRKEIRGALRSGVTVKRFTYLNSAGSLADIRGRAEKLWDQYQEYRATGRISGNATQETSGLAIPKPRGVIPEDILRDQPSVENPNYDKLMSVLMDAYEQAANGKGSERHANGLNFEDQDMIQIMDRVGIGFSLGQAIKKIVEGQRLRRGQAKKEFLGAIVYLAGAIIWMDKE